MEQMEVQERIAKDLADSQSKTMQEKVEEKEQ